MKQQEKAEELQRKFGDSAIMVVEEILASRPGWPYPHEIGVTMVGIYNQIHYPTTYWSEVKDILIEREHEMGKL